MTREEAIKLLTQYIDYDAETPDYYEMEKACKVALKVLKQESCEDCISRKAAIDALGYNISITSDEGLDEYRTVLKEMLGKIYDTQVAQIKALPSIQQKPKTGHWEWVQYDSNPEIGNFHCSECHFMPASFNWASEHLKYCPKCGAKMVEP